MAISLGTWRFVEPRVGAQPIATTSTSQLHPLGTEVRARDIGTTNYGEGRFIYLLGVASTAAGNTVSYNATTYQTTLLPNTANLNTPVAVAQSANVASQYGWYQVEGLCPIFKTCLLYTSDAADE